MVSSAGGQVRIPLITAETRAFLGGRVARRANYGQDVKVRQQYRAGFTLSHFSSNYYVDCTTLVSTATYLDLAYSAWLGGVYGRG